MSHLLDEVQQLVEELIPRIEPRRRAPLERTLSRLRDSTVRIAVVGRVKAGKSTLLNALVGEAVAPTDAAECTRVVTRYRWGPAYRAWLHRKQDPEPVPIRFTRTGGRVDIDLAGHPLETIDHVAVEVPVQRLEGLEIIDTPGLASATDTSIRTEQLLIPDPHPDGGSSAAEAEVMIYLLRHLHDADADFLDAFTAEDRPANPALAIGALSRCDEIGTGRGDAMELGRVVAELYRRDPRLRPRVQTVVPISGLLAHTAQVMRQDDYDLLLWLAGQPAETIDRVLISADDFLGERLEAVGEERRWRLIDRFGLFGIRWTIEMIRQQRVATASQLEAELRRLSGIEPLWTLVESQFSGRQQVLKADLALELVDRTSRSLGPDERRRIRSAIERIRDRDLSIRRLRALNQLRIEPPANLKPELLAEAERILGSSGESIRARVGLDRVDDVDRLRAHLSTRIGAWNTVENQRVSTGELQALARTVSDALTELFQSVQGQDGGPGRPDHAGRTAPTRTYRAK
jgi:hypothetical protein